MKNLQKETLKSRDTPAASVVGAKYQPQFPHCDMNYLEDGEPGEPGRDGRSSASLWTSDIAAELSAFLEANQQRRGPT